MQENSHISIERCGALGIITMNRPETFNALDAAMSRDLRKAALQLSRDRQIRAVILKGQERAFCSGADLKYVQMQGKPEDNSYLKPEGIEIKANYGQSFKEILEYLHSTISEIRRAAKPFLASVKGVAAAGGFGLAMSCDLVLACETASFEWAYLKTGLTGAESSTFMIPRLIGLRRAFDLVFLNPRLSARQAFEAGLVSQVLPVENFDEQVLELGQKLACGPSLAMGIAKQLINEAAGMDRLDLHMDRELKKLVEIADTADFAEGLDSFLTKRKAGFQGI